MPGFGLVLLEVQGSTLGYFLDNLTQVVLYSGHKFKSVLNQSLCFIKMIKEINDFMIVPLLVPFLGLKDRVNVVMHHLYLKS